LVPAGLSKTRTIIHNECASNMPGTPSTVDDKPEAHQSVQACLEQGGTVGKVVPSIVLRDAGNDILRGIAICVVLVIHTTGFWDSAPPGSLLARIYTGIRPIFEIWLPLFLIVSGYYVGRADIRNVHEYKEFLMKRLPRILVPYCIWSVVNFIIQYADGKMVLLDFLPGIAFGRMCYPYYFIPVLIKLYIAYPILCFCMRNRWRLMFLLIFLALLWLDPKSNNSNFSWNLRDNPWTEWVFRRSVHIEWAFLFFLGVLARRIGLVARVQDMARIRRAYHVRWILWCVCIFSASATLLVSSRFAVVLASAMFVLFNIADQTVLARRLKPLAWLGTMSYTIYLLHEPWLGYLQNALGSQLQAYPVAVQLPLLVFAVAFPTAIHWVCFRFMGRRAALVVG
jgi:peptidoglycan/LPS O-acetylase OafA/YrhL